MASATKIDVLAFGEGMTRPVRISGPDPVYTREALKARVQGLMIVKCIIDMDGLLHNCRVIKSLPFMDQAVLDALSARRYVPVTFQGQPITCDYVFNIKLVMPSAWVEPQVDEAQPWELDVSQAVDRALQDSIRAVVSSHQRSLFTCFREEAGRNPGFTARIPVELAIGNDGRVTQVWVDHPSYKSGPLAECLFREIQEWPFQPYEGRTITVSMSFSIAKRARERAAANIDASGPPREEIHQVVELTQAAFQRCVDQEREKNPGFRGGKVTLTAWVEGAGTVRRVVIDREDINRSDLGRCLKGAAGRMTFSAFQGDEVGIDIPLVLSGISGGSIEVPREDVGP